MNYSWAAVTAEYPSISMLGSAGGQGGLHY